MGSSWLEWLEHDGGSVCQNLGDTLGDLGGVVAHPDDAIRSQFRGVLHHQLESFLASLLAQIAVQGNVSAHHGLQARAYAPEQRARTHHDPADYPKVTLHAKARQIESGGHEFMRHHVI